MVSASARRVQIGRKSLWQRVVKDLRRYQYVYLMLLPLIIWYLLFCYCPYWATSSHSRTSSR